MTLGHFIAILRARWLLSLLVFVATVAITVTVSLMLPKQYQATASVVIDVKPDPVSAMMYAGMATPAFIATQVDVIQSDRVALRVVRDLKLTENPQIREQWLAATKGEGTIESWLADTFQRSMEVKPSRESSVITVTYKAPDPRFAAGLANAFVQAYIATSLELRVDPARQYTAFFDSRVKEARENLERAQAKLSSYQREKGILVSDERLDIETSRLNELSSQLVMLQALAAESTSRQSQARGASGDALQEVLNNPVVAGLKVDITRSEARLKELNSRLGDNHPQVQELKANIAELRTKLDSETRRVTGGVGVTNTINRAREAEVKSALEEQRTKVAKMKALRDEAAVLVRDSENAQRTYDAIVARLNQTSLESQTTQSSAYVLTQATAPAAPSSPKLVLNTLLSIFVGFLLAVGVALVRELMDRRVRGAQEIGDELGLPVLGVLPKPSSRRLFGRRAVPLMQQRIMARLPASGRGA